LKPDNKIYEALCRRSRLKPEEIFLADDGEKNVEAAKQFGIHSIFYTDFNGFVNELVKSGVKVDSDKSSKQEYYQHDKKHYKSYKKGWERKYKKTFNLLKF
jgi:FMN phosphatase YigB (HAD superfamily)